MRMPNAIALYLHSIICYANAECDLPSARRWPRALLHTRHALPLPMISLPLLPGSLEPDGSVPYSFSFCFLVFWSLVGLRFLGLLVSLLGCDQINWLVCICNVCIHNTYLGLAPLLAWPLGCRTWWPTLMAGTAHHEFGLHHFDN